MIVRIEQDTDGPYIQLVSESEAEYYQLSAIYKGTVAMKLCPCKDCDGNKIELTMSLKE